MRNELLLRYGYVGLAALIWGATGFFVKFSELSLLHVSFLRVAIPTFCTMFFMNKIQLTLRSNRFFYLISCLSLLRLLLQIFSFKYAASLGLSLVLIYCWPMFHYFILLICKREPFSKTVSMSLTASFCGVLLCLSSQPFSWTIDSAGASLAALGSALIIGINTLLIKDHCSKQSAMETVYLFNVVGTVVLLPFALDIASAPLPHLGIGVLYGFLIGFISFYLYFKALAKVASSHASVLTYLEVPSGMMIAYLSFHESVSGLSLFGGLVIFLSSLLLLRYASTQRTV